jgi:hypothetical protein
LNRLASGSSKRLAIAIVVIGLWGAFLPQSIRRDDWVFSWDSAIYIETAQSLLAGRGLQHRVAYDYGTRVWEPLRLWPPGYPLLIAGLAWTGLDARLAAIAISIGASVVVIVMLIVFWSALTHWSLALLGVGMLALNPAFVALSSHAMSDMPYYAAVLVACWCLDRWTRLDSRTGAWRWLLAAGLLSGVAWTLRNAALAWLFAVVVFFLAFRRPVSALLVWVCGVLACIGPVAIRNALVFGSAQPYSMPPSELSWLDNVRATLYQFRHDFAIPLLIDKYVIVAALLLVSPVIYRWVRARTAGAWQRVALTHAPLVLLLLFTVSTVVLLIVYRSMYWGEPINTRYLLPIYGPSAMIAVVGLLAFLTRLRVPPSMSLLLVGTLCGVGLAAQIAAHLERWQHQPIARQWTLLAYPMNAETLAYLGRTVGRDQFVVSDRADLIRLHAQVQAREPTSLAETWREPLTTETVRRLVRTGHLWGIVVVYESRARNGDSGPLIQQLLANELTLPELTRVSVDPSVVMFVANRSR